VKFKTHEFGGVGYEIGLFKFKLNVCSAFFKESVQHYHLNYLKVEFCRRKNFFRFWWRKNGGCASLIINIDVDNTVQLRLET
jgi:hypothetical protein